LNGLLCVVGWQRCANVYDGVWRSHWVTRFESRGTTALWIFWSRGKEVYSWSTLLCQFRSMTFLQFKDFRITFKRILSDSTRRKVKSIWQTFQKLFTDLLLWYVHDISQSLAAIGNYVGTQSQKDSMQTAPWLSS
jgi:hypothetical protein